MIPSKPNLRIEYHIIPCYGKATKTQEVVPMANPIILHIEAMLTTFDQEPLTAVYMVVKQMYDMQKQSNDRVS